MTYSIAKGRRFNPMWYFEHNYRALIEMVALGRLLEYGRVKFDLAGTRIEMTLLESSRYTLLVAIQQRFMPEGQQHLLGNLQFKVRLYLDAKLAEVVSYQGEQPREPRYSFPNERMYHPDEKRQTNLVLYDWLSNCSRLNFMESATLNY